MDISVPCRISRIYEHCYLPRLAERSEAGKLDYTVITRADEYELIALGVAQHIGKCAPPDILACSFYNLRVGEQAGGRLAHNAQKGWNTGDASRV